MKDICEKHDLNFSNNLNAFPEIISCRFNKMDKQLTVIAKKVILNKVNKLVNRLIIIRSII